MSRKDDLIVGLDIGTTKICVIVAERTENGVDVVGIGTHPSRGLRKGVVVDQVLPDFAVLDDLMASP